MAINFYNEWMNTPRWWFNANANDDIYIGNMYGHLLDECHEDKSITIQLIILDQLPRHVYRNEYSKHILAYFLRKAIEVLHRLNNKQVYFDGLGVNDWIFHMLPLRHTNDVGIIHYVMAETWKRLSMNPCDKLLKRFLKATYMRCPLTSQDMFWKEYVSDIKYPILRTRKAILASKIGKEVYQKLLPFKHQRLILSLSGGVDSMILSMILLALKDVLDLDIRTVMINYGNRAEADDEEAFVVDWCMKSIGFPLITRKIHEIKRDICREYELRDLYESYTRNVRYACYKQVGGKVLLGHNSDDTFENILTNIVQGKKHDNLKGMNHYSITDGIEFIRPMLNIKKTDIYEFAKEFEIPHLPDSTVAWCQRGIIRDKIKPVLTEWDERCVPAFFETSQIMTELYDVVHNQVIMYKDICVKGDGKWSLRFTNGATLPKSKIFWRMFLVELSGIHISNKSLMNLLDRIAHHSGLAKYHIELHKQITLYMNQLEGLLEVIVNN